MSEHGSAPSVTVSIVSTGEADKVRTCLASILAQDFDGRINVVVTENGVRDGTAAAAHAADPDAHVIVNEHKRGFSANHNAAIAARPADFALVLNPDVMLAPSCLRELVSALGRHPRAGLAGPLLRYPSGDAQPSARRFPRLAGTIVRRTPLRTLVGRRLRTSAHYLAPPTEDRAVDWLLGACLLARAAAWRRVGGFDAGFHPLYVEDIDLAWRMWHAGWEVWQAPPAVAVHEHQAATDNVFLDRRTLWHARGMLRFVRKHPRILVSARRPAALPAALP